ncbi:hypothetical protein D3C73_663670 [compost metagenome]
MEPWNVRVPCCRRMINYGSLSHNKTYAILCPAFIIFRYVLPRYAARRLGTRHRSHHDSIRELQIPSMKWFEQWISHFITSRFTNLVWLNITDGVGFICHVSYYIGIFRNVKPIIPPLRISRVKATPRERLHLISILSSEASVQSLVS